MTNEFKEGLVYYPEEERFSYNVKVSPIENMMIYISFETVQDLVKKYLIEKGDIKNV